MYTGYTHLLMESVCVTTHRHLSPLHPIHRILAPHLLFLPAVNAWVASLLTYLLFTLGRLSLTFVTFTHDQFYTLLSSRRCVRRLPLDVLLRRFYSPVHMTNCFSYYRFLLSCVIGLIVGGALNTHVELELKLVIVVACFQWTIVSSYAATSQGQGRSPHWWLQHWRQQQFCVRQRPRRTVFPTDDDNFSRHKSTSC